MSILQRWANRMVARTSTDEYTVRSKSVTN
jgi:hypothetical protein